MYDEIINNLQEDGMSKKMRTMPNSSLPTLSVTKSISTMRKTKSSNFACPTFKPIDNKVVECWQCGEKRRIKKNCRGKPQIDSHQASVIVSDDDSFAL